MSMDTIIKGRVFCNGKMVANQVTNQGVQQIVQWLSRSQHAQITNAFLFDTGNFPNLVDKRLWTFNNLGFTEVYAPGTNMSYYANAGLVLSTDQIVVDGDYVQAMIAELTIPQGYGDFNHDGTPRTTDKEMTGACIVFGGDPTQNILNGPNYTPTTSEVLFSVVQFDLGSVVKRYNTALNLRWEIYITNPLSE